MTDVQFGHLFLVYKKYHALQEVVGYSERYHTVVSNNTVFQLPFNTRQRLERAVTDIHSFEADSV